MTDEQTAWSVFVFRYQYLLSLNDETIFFFVLLAVLAVPMSL